MTDARACGQGGKSARWSFVSFFTGEFDRLRDLCVESALKKTRVMTTNSPKESIAAISTRDIILENLPALRSETQKLREKLQALANLPAAVSDSLFVFTTDHLKLEVE